MSASISSRFTEDILLDDYYLVSESIKMLSGSVNIRSIGGEEDSEERRVGGGSRA